MVNPAYRAMLDAITKPYDPRQLPPGRFWNAIATALIYSSGLIGLATTYFLLLFLLVLLVGFPVMAAFRLL